MEVVDTPSSPEVPALFMTLITLPRMDAAYSTMADEFSHATSSEQKNKHCPTGCKATCSKCRRAFLIPSWRICDALRLIAPSIATRYLTAPSNKVCCINLYLVEDRSMESDNDSAVADSLFRTCGNGGSSREATPMDTATSESNVCTRCVHPLVLTM